MVRQDRTREEQTRRIGLFGRVLAIAALVGSVTTANAQYFRVHPSNEQEVTLRSHSLDTISLVRMAPFAIPQLSDTTVLNYHEPMPDSLMPRSAIVIGRVTVVEEEGDIVVEKLEKFARESGANWIVSFSEPRARLTADGWKYYRSTALLLRVLDPTLIPEAAVTAEYEATAKMHDYADVMQWYDTYSKHYGAR